jgi:GrpB-like predicted nucleotidyltransferase (UPF0157 family)
MILSWSVFSCRVEDQDDPTAPVSHLDASVKADNFNPDRPAICSGLAHTAIFARRSCRMAHPVRSGELEPSAWRECHARVPERDAMNAPAERIADALQVARIIRRLKEHVRPGELAGETVEQFVRRYSRVRLPKLDLNIQSDYDPNWPQSFENEKKRLHTALVGDGVIGIEHIGSTSIPHLSSKNILDIAVAMRAPLSIERQTLALGELGYQAYGESPIAESFSWFWRIGQDSESSFVVHTCPADSQRFTDIKNFRDFMRAYPEEQRRYVDLKRELAAVPGQSWLEYSVSKKILVARITARANAWAMAHGKPEHTALTVALDPQPKT